SGGRKDDGLRALRFLGVEERTANREERRAHRSALARRWATPEPLVRIRIELDYVAAVPIRAAVMQPEQIYQNRTHLRPRTQPNDAWGVAEIMERDDRVSAPVVAHREHVACGGPQHLPVAPADFRTLLAHPNRPLHPVEHRMRVTPLRFHVDALVSIDG